MSRENSALIQYFKNQSLKVYVMSVESSGQTTHYGIALSQIHHLEVCLETDVIFSSELQTWTHRFAPQIPIIEFGQNTDPSRKPLTEFGHVIYLKLKDGSHFGLIFPTTSSHPGTVETWTVDSLDSPQESGAIAQAQTTDDNFKAFLIDSDRIFEKHLASLITALSNHGGLPSL